MIGFEEAHSDMSRHVESEVIYKVPLCLPCVLCSQKFWPLFREKPLLQEAEPGIQCPAEDQEWQRSEQWDVWGERQCQEFHCAAGRYASRSLSFLNVFVLVLYILCCASIVWCHCCVCTWQNLWRGFSRECLTCMRVSKCVYLRCSTV